MTPMFTINFRREAYLQAQARARRRVVVLGIWVAYFGVLAIVIGLYLLNATALSRRLHQIEEQTAQVRRIQGSAGGWKISASELEQIERFAKNPRLWHDRLARLATVLPPNVTLGSIVVNPLSASNANENRLVLSGQLRAAANEDRMQGVVRFVNLVHADSVFARSYRTVRLTSTRVSEGSPGVAEFVIECR